MRSNQKVRQQSPRLRAALLFSPRRILLKRRPRPPPNLLLALPLHRNPRLFAEPIDKRLRPSRRANQLRIHHAAHRQRLPASRLLQRLSRHRMQRMRRVPQRHDDVGVQSNRHSSSPSSWPRISLIHFCIAFRPLPMPGFPIPAYFSNTLPSRTAFTCTTSPLSSNSSLSPARTPSFRRMSRGTVICPLLVSFACLFMPFASLFIPALPFLTLSHRFLTFFFSVTSVSLWPS